MGMEFLSGVMKMTPKLIVVVTAQLREDTKNHQIVHFKEINCMTCELHLKKTYF